MTERTCDFLVCTRLLLVNVRTEQSMISPIHQAPEPRPSIKKAGVSGGYLATQARPEYPHRLVDWEVVASRGTLGDSRAERTGNVHIRGCKSPVKLVSRPQTVSRRKLGKLCSKVASTQFDRNPDSFCRKAAGERINREVSASAVPRRYRPLWGIVPGFRLIENMATRGTLTQGFLTPP